TTGRMQATVPGYTPRWLDGGTALQVETTNRSLAIYPISAIPAPEGPALPPVPDGAMPGSARTVDEPTLAPVELRMATYPTTIRVAHHPSNGCRAVPDWQVDTIPFEEYIARVVPAETPSWWPVDALAAQAVAARTYAWQKILAGRADYDVTDWANYQMMCDVRHANSDTAVAMTQGQYLTTIDDANRTPIAAMYSAENGHPTLTNPNVSYLQSVPDRFALGRERWGHGYGLSQWGAYRRATAGQTYRQILGHYYTNVYLRDARSPANPVVAFIGNEPPYQVATDSVALRTLRPATLAVHYTISATAGLTDDVAIAPALTEPSALIWRAATPLPDGAHITASLWISDHVQETISWQVDHQPPPVPVMTVPEMITTAVITLAVPVDTEVPLLRADWQWAGTALSHTANSGAAIADNAASAGVAWAADPERHDAGVWYGPYTKELPAGHSYRALFWLRAALPLTATIHHKPIGRLDVTDDEGCLLLGLRDLSAADFGEATTYHPIAVDFHLFDDPQGLEFRVAWAGVVGLALDRVDLWQLPDALVTADGAVQRAAPTKATALFVWTVAHDAPVMAANTYKRTLYLRAADAAGNL
ncbi:MAG: hypothetical protein KDE47_15155, partial [Caldilineaceae bacterium]|nr:hypothetical protein [Caldilineaceae bacterium]